MAFFNGDKAFSADERAAELYDVPTETIMSGDSLSSFGQMSFRSLSAISIGLLW